MRRVFITVPCLGFNLGIALRVGTPCLGRAQARPPILPLSRRISDWLPAVSCRIPPMRAVIGHEEKGPAVVRHITSGYPRFILHSCLRQLTDHLTRTHGVALVPQELGLRYW